ncbi:MAG: cation:proton antiporter [Salibacteraceae bacterium]
MKLWLTTLGVVLGMLLQGFEPALAAHTDVLSSDHESSVVSVDQTESDQSETANGNDHHGPDTSPLFFIIMAVFIGAATRHFLKRIPVPFTALLLIIGIVLGVLNRMGLFMQWGDVDVSFIHDSIIWAAHIDPHMLFFVFLPILIFEAAFAMDLHTFKKSFGNSVILAVPGILIALVLTGVLVYAIDILNIGLEGWANWSLAFMFGSVISATDPVAVVALLKDLGASKKLGTLIEGESLLNDGTAIVLFMVFFLAVSGQANETNGFVEFLRVAIGGVGVGLAIGWIVLRWIKGVFNDAMVEISVVVAAAYISFYVAEDFLHVSGVLALVALGLLVGGFGRSSISPQVEHFMHEFWELAGFIANCLIFLIVGFVIAERTEFTLNDFLILFIVYAGVHVVRAIVMFALYPFMKNTGYGLPKKDAIVVWYGALRGAIALALALIVVGVDASEMGNSMGVSTALAAQIQNQFLFLIAGTVTLTLLVNATTIKLLIYKLGLLDIPPIKALMVRTASEHMRTAADEFIQKLKTDRHLRRANWSTVAQYLPKEFSHFGSIDAQKLEKAKVAEHRTRILEKEKSSYWRQFKEGLLGGEALRKLTETVNEILDIEGEVSLSDRKDLEDLWRPPKWLSKVQSLPVIGNVMENAFFERLAVSYECAAGFVKAQEDCLKLLQVMYRADEGEERKSLEKIEQEINENIISGQTYMRNLRHTYPEIYRAIATRQAIRSVLNYELTSVGQLKAKGRLNNDEAGKIVSNIESRMKQLMEKPPSIELPETRELIKSVSWLESLPKEGEKLLINLCQTKIYSNGQRIVKHMSSSLGLYIIVRGNVNIKDGKRTIEVLGKGDCIGEIVYLTQGQSNNIGIAETPVTVLWLSASSVEKMVAQFPQFKEVIWKHAMGRIALRALANKLPFAAIDKRQLRTLGESGKVVHLKAGGHYSVPDKKAVVLISGVVRSVENPKLIVENVQQISFKKIEPDVNSWLLEVNSVF